MEITKFIVNNTIAEGLDLIGDRWTLLILRDAFLGRTRFEQFRQHIGVSKSTLVRRLSLLLEHKLLIKQLDPNGKRYEYKLSKKARGLFFAALLAWQWELDWVVEKSGQKESEMPYALFHKKCSHVLHPQAVCTHCKKNLYIGDVEMPGATLNSEQQMHKIKSLNKQRRRTRVSGRSVKEDLSLKTISDLIGDRWTILLLIASFFGVRRYDGFIKHLNIASNILTTRLKELVEVGVLDLHQYQDNPPRNEYYLSNKGKSLYPIVMAIRQWVIDWNESSEQFSNLIHASCGNELSVGIVCGNCLSVPILKEVGLIELSQ